MADSLEGYEPGEELKLLSDGALESAEGTLDNALGGLEYVETLVPPAPDDVPQDADTPAGAAVAAAHDVRELLRRVRTEKRRRENESLDDY